MRTSNAIIIAAAITFTFFLCSCATTHRSTTRIATNFINKQTVVATTKELYPPKNPQNIALYADDQKPLSPYRIIGIATVSKRNFMGKQRENDTLDSMMKGLAASIGGDAIIKTSSNDEAVKANVIQFQRILI